MLCNQYRIDTKDSVLIGFAGPPSSGKDVMSDALCSALINHACKVPEEARKYIQETGPLYSVFQQYIIADRQQQHESEIVRNYQIAVSASPLFLAYFYAVLLKTENPTLAEEAVVVDIYKKAMQSLQRYDYIFVCEPFQEYSQDSVRYQTDIQLDVINRSIRAFLDLHEKTYCILPSVPVDERLQICFDYLNAKTEGN